MASGDSRNKILETSIDLFCEHGFSKASMRDIARAADITLSVIYNHFKDKYDILYTIIMGIGLDLADAIDRATEESSPGVEALSNIIVTQMCLVKERPKEIKIYLEDQYLLPQVLRSTVLSQHRSIYIKYHRQIETMEKDGDLKSINKAVITFSILAMVNWAYRWYQEDGRLTMEGVAKDTVKLCLGGILEVPVQRLESCSSGSGDV